MSMILKSYGEGIVLPPEGSDEWFALLPGWSGWMYSPGVVSGESRNIYQIRTYNFSNIDNDTGYVYWNIWEGKTGDITTSNRGYVGSILYCKIGNYYYFRGKLRQENYSYGMDAFEVARATSLTPQI